MSQELQVLNFPLKGSRLIEASAGTGKTWTIAGLYVRLVLGHGEGCSFTRPLLPCEILVMTFTKAATRELSDRIRERLVEAARCFRGKEPHDEDTFLRDLISCYKDEESRKLAAHRLMLAAEAMDESAVFTIDAWCQRMLREHAFDSGCLFDEELVSSEENLFADAVRDYWRHQVYALDGECWDAVRSSWGDLSKLESKVRALVDRRHLLGPSCGGTLASEIRRVRAEEQRVAAALKPVWAGIVGPMRQWFAANKSKLNGNKLRQASVDAFFDAIDTWVADPEATRPGHGFAHLWRKMTPAGLADCCKNGQSVAPTADYQQVEVLHDAYAAIESMEHALISHAACAIHARMAEIKAMRRQFGFADMLRRLKEALECPNGAVLRERIVNQYPVALIDEFQDTSPDQYRVFDLLYRVADETDEHGLFLIGDPKQAIYGFRGADIHSYLDARRATSGRHYRLGTNYRSTHGLIEAVNHLFTHAEGCGDKPGHASGAFRFRTPTDHPLPFEPVGAKGRRECLVSGEAEVSALTLLCCTNGEMKADEYRRFFAGVCAERIVTLLNDPATGFREDGGFRRLEAADIAVLVRDRSEAAAVRRALQERGVPCVYLSDKDSVFQSTHAADVLRWLEAVASPTDASLARAAFATATAALPLTMLAELATDDLAWDARVEQLKALHLIWQRQGVLAMLRRLIHDFDLPATMLAQTGGERALTDLLHLAELLQTASEQLDGEQALIRWLAEQIENDSDGGDERILRLESDAELVKVVTVHKSKGLEYPLVFLPFAVSAKPVDRRNRSFGEYTDASGVRRIDLGLSDATLDAMEKARLDEDLRLFYVALTRARHALWLGVASLKDRIHECALGWLLSGGHPVTAAEVVDKLRSMCCECNHIEIQTVCGEHANTSLSREDNRAELVPAPGYDADFERDWAIASYTSLTKDLSSARAPSTPLEEKLLENHDTPAVGRSQDTPWHRFPRGPLPGMFLHEQLEWMAQEGFSAVGDEHFAARLGARCDRAGWGHRKEDTVEWLTAVADTELPAIGARLADLVEVVPEMEFWIPADNVELARFDALCRESLLEGAERPPLAEKELRGMLRGFKDLVFKRGEKYWVLDYKSNALGVNDAAYHSGALAAAVAQHRYDVQGMIYLLALHRLLASRLGSAYDPQNHLGGAVFFFLRGIGNADTRGCYQLDADPALIDEIDTLFPQPAVREAA